MAAVFAVIYLAMAAGVMLGLRRRYRANADLATQGVFPAPSGRRSPDGPARHREDDLIALRRQVVTVGAILVGLATIGFVSLATGLTGLAWLTLSMSIAAFVLLAGTVLGAKPGLRVYDNGVHLGFVAEVERNRTDTFSNRLGIVHHAVFLPFEDIATARLIEGVKQIAAEQHDMAALAPVRMSKGKPVPMKVLGDFYGRGMPHALYVRVHPGRVPEVPVQALYAGPGRREISEAVYWPGPEFLIGVKDPIGLRQALEAGRPDLNLA